MKLLKNKNTIKILVVIFAVAFMFIFSIEMYQSYKFKKNIENLGFDISESLNLFESIVNPDNIDENYEINKVLGIVNLGDMLSDNNVLFKKVSSRGWHGDGYVFALLDLSDITNLPDDTFFKNNVWDKSPLPKDLKEKIFNYWLEDVDLKSFEYLTEDAEYYLYKKFDVYDVDTYNFRLFIFNFSKKKLLLYEKVI